MVARGRMAAPAQIDQPYSPGGANVHTHLTHGSLGPRISIGSAGLTVTTNTRTGVAIGCSCAMRAIWLER